MTGRILSYALTFFMGFVLLAAGIDAAHAASSEARMTKDEVPRISVDELKQHIEDEADIVILDVRSPGSYKSSKIRIPGDVRVEGPGDLNSKVASLDLAARIITYCT